MKEESKEVEKAENRYKNLYPEGGYKTEEESKYYTPVLSEFHEGFEYEVYNERSNEWYKDVWDVISEFGDSKLYHLDVKKCRVKHLTREDIESLGFEVMGGQMMSGGRIDCQKEYKDPRGVYDKAMITFTPSINWVMIAVGDDEISFHDWNTLFAGTIKNKSQLKQVLKMIGV